VFFLILSVADAGLCADI